jgi:hypothetical protein
MRDRSFDNKIKENFNPTNQVNFLPNVTKKYFFSNNWNLSHT